MCGLFLAGARTLPLALTPGNPPNQDSATPRPTHTLGTGLPRARDGGDRGSHATSRDPRNTDGP